MLTKPFSDRELMDIVFTQLKLGNLTQATSDNLMRTALDLLPV